MNCEICDAQMKFYSSFKGFSIYKCKSCGFGRANVSVDDVKELYEGSYFATYYGANSSIFGTCKSAELDDNSSIDSSKKWWLDRFVSGNNIRVLEVGPGAAPTVQRYLAGSRQGVAYETVEFSRTACDELERRGIAYHCGLIYQSDIAKTIANRFDYVVGTEVIEHDLHPHDFVRGLAQALRPGGRACLTTGNFDGLTARLMRGRWYYLHPPVHVCFYSPRSVKILFERNGFENVQVDCIGTRYYSLHERFPVPGFLPLIRALQVPTGMTIVAEKMPT
jgi:SAM-dependent methyltransferase